MRRALVVLAIFHGSLGIAWYEVGPERQAPRLREVRPQAVAVIGVKPHARLALRTVANMDVSGRARGWYASAGVYLDF